MHVRQLQVETAPKIVPARSISGIASAVELCALALLDLLAARTSTLTYSCILLGVYAILLRPSRGLSSWFSSSAVWYLPYLRHMRVTSELPRHIRNPFSPQTHFSNGKHFRAYILRIPPRPITHPWANRHSEEKSPVRLHDTHIIIDIYTEVLLVNVKRWNLKNTVATIGIKHFQMFMK